MVLLLRECLLLSSVFWDFFNYRVELPYKNMNGRKYKVDVLCLIFKLVVKWYITDLLLVEGTILSQRVSLRTSLRPNNPLWNIVLEGDLEKYWNFMILVKRSLFRLCKPLKKKKKMTKKRREPRALLWSITRNSQEVLLSQKLYIEMMKSYILLKIENISNILGLK